MEKVARPSTVRSETEEMHTGCGSLHITVGYLDERKPIEIFAYLGKNGGCAACQNEALGRAISLGLKYGIPAEAFIKELSGIQCPSPNMWPEHDRTLSCPDAMARALVRFMNEDHKGA